jgi:DNA-binding beta-propeller fold protein YncE
MPSRLPSRRRALAATVLAAALGAAGCGREDPVGEDPGDGPGAGRGPAAGAPAEPLPFPPRAFEPGRGGRPPGRPEGRTVQVGGRPEGVAVDPGSGLAAVGVKGPDGLVLLDVRTGRIVRRVPLSSGPRHVQLAAPGGPFLVPAEATDELVEVFPDGRTQATKVGDNPHDATARDGTAWTADEFSSTVSEVRDGRTVRRVPVDVQPGGIVALEDGTVAVVSVRAYTVELLDRDLRPLGSQNAGYGPSHVVADVRGRLYIADTRGGGISVFDTRPRLRFAARLELPGSPYGLALDRGRGRLWVTRTARNEVAEIDVSGRPRVLRTLGTIQQPNTVGVDPETGTLVIASASTGTVQLLRP